jgi:hypothetical protein
VQLEQPGGQLSHMLSEGFGNVSAGHCAAVPHWNALRFRNEPVLHEVHIVAVLAHPKHVGEQVAHVCDKASANVPSGQLPAP